MYKFIADADTITRIDVVITEKCHTQYVASVSDRISKDKCF
jgi:hypothetical protein